MTDIEKMLITSMITIVAGIIIFIGGQVLLKFIIEPLQNLRKKLSEIQHALIFHAPAIHTPVGDIPSEKEASKAFESSGVRSESVNRSYSILFVLEKILERYA